MNAHSTTRAVLLLAGALGAPSCDGSNSPSGPPPPPLLQLTLQQSSANFAIQYSEASAHLIGDYLAELEANLPRVLDDFDVTLTEPIVGLFWPDFQSFSINSGFGFGAGAVVGPNRFHLVAIPYEPGNVVHEMAHCVTWHLAAPRLDTIWLWESIAGWEARQCFPPSTIPQLVAGDFPTLAELNDFNNRPSVYHVGCTITEFIIEEWGLEALRQLVVSRGDIEGTLGISTAEFEARWQRFVERRYL